MADFLFSGTPEEEKKPDYLFTGTTSVPTPTPDIADQRAQKLDLALGEQSPGAEQLSLDIQVGLEDSHRETLAIHESTMKHAERLSLLQDYIQQKGAPSTADERELFLSLTEADLQEDPKDIVEKVYARTALSGTLHGAANPTFDFGLTQDPEKTHGMMDSSEAALMFKEGAQRILEDQEARVQDQSWLGYGWDFAKSMIPTHTWGTLLETRETPGTEGALPAGIQASARDYLLSLPPEKGLEELRRMADGMDPQTGAWFVGNVLHYASSARVLDNILIAGGDATLIGGAVARLLRGGVKGVNALKDARIAKKALGKDAAEAIDRGTRTLDGKPLDPDVPLKRGGGSMSAGEAEFAARFKAHYQSGMSPADAYAAAKKEAGQPAPKVAEASKTADPTTAEAVQVFRAETESLEREAVDYADDINQDALKATPEERTRRTLRDTLKGLFRRKPSQVEHLASAGHVDEAAEVGAIQQLKNLMTQGFKSAERTGADTYGREMPTMFRPNRWIRGEASSFAQEQMRRILREVLTTTPALLKALNQGLKISRLPEGPDMLAAMVLQAKERVRLQYPRLADTIFDARPEVIWGPTGDVYQVGVYFGNENATLFKTARDAQKHADFQGFRDYKVRQRGSGFYYVVHKAVDETDPNIRKLILETDNRTPRSLATAFWGLLRSPDELISKVSREDRKASVFGTNETLAFLEESGKKIGSLPTKSRRDLFTFIDNDRSHVEVLSDPDLVKGGKTQTQVGRFANTLGEFDSRWRETFGRGPSEREVVAYMEYVRLHELDWAFRNFQIYKQKSRLGVENLVHKLLGKMEVRTVKDIPWQESGNPGVLVLREGEEPLFFRKNDALATNKPIVDNLLNGEGHRAFQIKPFSGDAPGIDPNVAKLLGKDKVHYLVTAKHELKPLSLKQLPRRGGGHIRYTEGHYIAQPSMTRLERGGALEHRYDFDNNVWHVTNEAKGREVAADLDKVRVMLRDGTDESAIREFISASKLPAGVDEVLGLFKPKMGKNGEVYAPPFLGLEDPIALRASGTRLGDSLDLKTKYQNFVDSADDPHNFYETISREYTGARNDIIDSADRIGSEELPMFRTEPSKLVDVQSVLNRSLRDVLQSKYTDDLKLKEVEKFVQEFGHVLTTSADELARNPLKHVFNPQWNKNADRMELAAAKNSLMSLRQFLGVQTEFSKNLQFVKTKVLNSIYSRFGQKGLDIAEPMMLHTTKDPLKYARSFAFHMKLGLFSPVQIFLQAQTFTHMTAIAGPKVALKAGPGALLMRGLKFTDEPEVINHFAKIASRMGWNEADFKEAYNALRESGMDRVGKEVGIRDDVFDPQLIQTKAGKLADWSTTFFNEGERFVRVSAYNAAYLEWRQANPVAKLTMKTRREILERADLYSGNMTRASNASWQRGFASIPTQFFAYQARIAEQLLGKRLTKVEKARVLGMYSMIYGLPVAASATTMVWPWDQTVKTQLMQRGIPYDENIISKGLIDGFGSVMLEAITGTDYNFGERYGPGGVSPLRDFLMGEKDGWDLVLGVSGTTLRDAFSAVAPIAVDVADMMQGGQDYAPLLIEDMIQATREATSVNNALKMVHGLNYGKYISKHEMYITDVTPTESLFIGLSGLTPSKVSKSFMMQDILKAENDGKKSDMASIQEDIRRALRNPEERDKWIKRAKLKMVRSNLNFHDMSQTLSSAFKNWQSFTDTTRWKFGQSNEDRLRQYIQDESKANE
jgi:hypothetical protein